MLTEYFEFGFGFPIIFFCLPCFLWRVVASNKEWSGNREIVTGQGGGKRTRSSSAAESEITPA